MEQKLVFRLKLLRLLTIFFAEIGPELSKEIMDVDTCFEEFVSRGSRTNNRFRFRRVSQ